MKAKKNLKLLLSEFFPHNGYLDAIILIRAAIQHRKMYKEHWTKIKELVYEQNLDPNEALWLIHHKANLVLYENTEEEAYKWFELLIRNVEAESDEQIINYTD